MPKLFIGPYKTGLQFNLEPWLINQEAFVDLFNAYVWRGRVKKKQGIKLVGRLHVQKKGQQVTIPDFMGNTVAPATTFAGNINAVFLPISPGTVEITVGALVFTDNGNGTLTSPAVNANYGIIDYNTGAFTLYFNPAIGAVAVWLTACLSLPRLPVMGIGTREEDPINQEQTIVFDSDYSYDFNQGTQQFRDVSFYKMAAPQNALTWTGTNANFFWTTNYYQVTARNIFWATNNVIGNHSRALVNSAVPSTLTNNGGFLELLVGAGHTFIPEDYVYLDEISLAGAAQGYNGLAGRITAVTATTIVTNIPFIAASAGASNGWVFALTRTISGDGIRYYDGFGVDRGWRNFAPPLQQYSATVTPNYLVGCLILIPYKNRFLAFNTFEQPAAGGGQRYSNRVRWSQNGTPFYATALVPSAVNQPRAGTQWVDNVVGKGGYIDAPTTEAIVSVALYKDTCLVFFERSTWQLRYTGNELLPFVWERINEQMGAESTFSPVYFDEGVLAIGDKGIVAANSMNVTRIDEYIPDLVYSIHNASEGVARVHGIRDFQRKMCYWTYPEQDTIYSNAILSFNYDEKCYSIFDNSHTCFGFLQDASDITWGSNTLWSSETKWDSAKLQSYYPHVIAGNQVGFVHYFDTDAVVNDVSLDLTTTIATPNSITNTVPAIAQVLNHNLKSGQFVRILYTTGFAVNVVAEAEGTAVLGSTSFIGTLTNLGLFPGFLQITIGANVFTDLGDGTMAGGTGGSTIDYETGMFVVNFAALVIDTAVTANYSYNELNYRIFKILVQGDNTFSLLGTNLTAFAAYTGSGQIEVVDNFRIKTKTLNPFLEQDLETRINYLNIYLTTASMNFVINTYGDDDTTTILDTNIASNENYYQFQSDKTWNRAYPNLTAPFFQLEMTMNDAQMLDFNNVNNLFELHAMILDVNTGARLR